MITHIETKRKEDVVPDEHLHFGVFTRIDRHHVAVDDCHRSTSRGRHEVTMDLNNVKIINCSELLLNFLLKLLKIIAFIFIIILLIPILKLLLYNIYKYN